MENFDFQLNKFIKLSKNRFLAIRDPKVCPKSIKKWSGLESDFDKKIKKIVRNQNFGLFIKIDKNWFSWISKNDEIDEIWIRDLVIFLSISGHRKRVFFDISGGGSKKHFDKMAFLVAILPRQLWSKLREFKTLLEKTGKVQLCHTNIYRDNPVSNFWQFLSGGILTIVGNRLLFKMGGVKKIDFIENRGGVKKIDFMPFSVKPRGVMHFLQLETKT